MSTKLRILIADDHEECRWAMMRLLSGEFDVIAAVADGQKLVDAAKLLLPDVIVSDIRMPILQRIHLGGSPCFSAAFDDVGDLIIHL